MDNILVDVRQRFQEAISEYFQQNIQEYHPEVMELIQMIIDFVNNANEHVTFLIHAVWRIDYREDILDYMSAKELTKTHIDQIKNIRIEHGQQPVLFNARVRSLINELNHNYDYYLREIFDVEYIATNQLYNEQQHLVNVAQRIDILFNRLAGDLFATTRNILRQEITPYDNTQHLNTIRDRLVSNNIITVGNMLQYAQLSDFDFVKSTCVLSIFDAFISSNIDAQFIRDKLQINSIFIAIKIAQHFNFVHKDQHVPFASLIGDQIHTLSNNEKQRYQSVFEREHHFQEDKTLTGDRFVYLIRPQYGKLFDTPFQMENEILCRGVLSGEQFGAILQVIQLAQNQQQYDMLEREQIQEQIVSGIYGNVINIVSQRIRHSIESYRQIISQDVQSISLFITIVLQIPYDDFMVQQNSPLLVGHRKFLNQLQDISHYSTQAAAQFIQQRQIVARDGASEYLTINLQFLKQTERWFRFSDINEDIKAQIAWQIQILLANYGDDSQISESKISALTGGLSNAIIRKILIRPFFHSENRRVQLQNDQLLEQMQNVNIIKAPTQSMDVLYQTNIQNPYDQRMLLLDVPQIAEDETFQQLQQLEQQQQQQQMAVQQIEQAQHQQQQQQYEHDEREYYNAQAEQQDDFQNIDIYFNTDSPPARIADLDEQEYINDPSYYQLLQHEERVEKKRTTSNKQKKTKKVVDISKKADNLQQIKLKKKDRQDKKEEKIQLHSDNNKKVENYQAQVRQPLLANAEQQLNDDDQFLRYMTTTRANILVHLGRYQYDNNLQITEQDQQEYQRYIRLFYERMENRQFDEDQVQEYLEGILDQTLLIHQIERLSETQRRLLLPQSVNLYDEYRNLAYTSGVQHINKRQKRNFDAVLSQIDQTFEAMYAMHRSREDCIQLFNRQLKIIFDIDRNVDSWIEMSNFRDYAQQNDLNIQFVTYSVGGIMNTVKDDKYFIAFVGQQHVFLSNIDLYKKHKASLDNSKRKQHNKICQQIKNVRSKPLKLLIQRHEFDSVQYLIDRCKANVYFDFETTYDDQVNRFENQGARHSEDVSVREQIDFAISIVADIKFDLNRILHESAYNTGIKLREYNPQLLIYKNNEQQAFWGYPASKYLFTKLNEYRQNINRCIIEFNRQIIRHNIKIETTILNTIQCFSYNGAKFDNHFVLSYIKLLEGNQWINHVQIIGDQTDMKRLQYRDFVFLDMRLMTGGQSLKQFCKDMNINQDLSKKEIDISLMINRTSCEQHKDKIMEYVLYDSIALHQIHKQFQKSVRRIIADYCVQQQSVDDCLNNNDDMQRVTGSTDEYTNIYKCLKGRYKNWMTISSLASKVYFDFFCTHTIVSPTDDQAFQMMSDSYQGGYTQSMFIGEVDASQGIYYLDYNSMYPAIMCNLALPFNLSGSKARTIDPPININRFNVRQMLGLDTGLNPLIINAGSYAMRCNINNFSLYRLTKFKFKQSTFAPQFGIITQKHGTIYPKQYDYDQHHKLGKQPVVFGFQIAQAFRINILDSLQIDRCMEFPKYTKTGQIFKAFDSFMYDARSNYKKQKNSSMAQCIKIFINSLYGKFGQKHHDLSFYMNRSQFNDDQQFQDILRERVLNMPNIDSTQLTQRDFDMITVKNTPLFDLNNRDSDLINVTVGDIPHVNNHVGSFVYFASIITAIGRTQITSIINQVHTPRRKIYYADTDSLIMSKEAYLACARYVDIDDVKLGSMKNEYPDGCDSSKSAVQRLIVINKKIYQYMVNNVWINKFKGCRNPSDDILQQFKHDDCRYSQRQTRFKKRNGNVSIIDFDMHFKLRLSRNVIYRGESQITFPFDSLSDHEELYGDVENRLMYSQELDSWDVY